MEQQRERAHADAFFRLQILQVLLSQRARQQLDEYDEDGEEDGEEEDGEEEIELLSAQAAFYEEERRNASSGAMR